MHMPFILFEATHNTQTPLLNYKYWILRRLHNSNKNVIKMTKT